MAQIRFEKIGKCFKDVHVIKEFDLTIHDGEFFTFVGPSGCGKSTILNMVAGLEPATEGRIYFDGQVVNELSPKERDVAMVFQNYALYPHMTVYENIAFPLKMRKTREEAIDSEVKRVAMLLGLEALIYRRPKELSGGQRQRVALGRAIIRKPKVFLMDEPLSNLDARLRVETRGEIKRLHQDLGITTIYVTHDQAEAMSLSDRVAVVKKGEIQQCSAPNEVYSLPSNTFVAGFIGNAPMNFITASVRGTEPVEVDCNGMVLRLSAKDMPEDLRLLVGARPEDLLISAGKSETSMEVNVSIIEAAGSFNWVDVIWNDIRVRGISKPGEDLKPGGRAFMEFPFDKAVVFDEVSGRRLSKGVSRA